MKIVDKVFDESKKIIRSVFKGAPNLITTSDVNRQFEAIKAQLDQLDEKTGMFIEGANLGYSLDSGTFSARLEYDTIRFKGCLFSPRITTLNIDMTSSAPNVCLCLVADKEEVTYESDFTHEIAGAKFMDGLTKPAANQLVYKNEQLLLTHSVSTVENLVGIVASFKLVNGRILVKENFTEGPTSNMLLGSEVIRNLNPDAKGGIKNYTTYEDAFSILENRANNIATSWQSFLDPSDSSDTNIKFRIQNGVVYLNMPAKEFVLPADSLYRRLLTIGVFPSSIKTTIVDYFKGLNLAHYDMFNYEDKSSATGRFIPYGEFGSFSVFAPTGPSGKDGWYTSGGYGVSKVSLVIKYDASGNIDDVVLGAYIDHSVLFDNSGAEHTMFYGRGPVTWFSMSGGKADATVYTPRMFGAVPLVGVY